MSLAPVDFRASRNAPPAVQQASKIVLLGNPQPLKVVPEWKEYTLVIRKDNKTVLTIDGMRYGNLCVHPSFPDDPPAVCVTHIPTKLAASRVATVDDAVKIAEQLWAKCEPAMLCDELEDVLRRIPADAKAWLQACSKDGKCV